jgi:hypothetical protein
MLDFDLFTLLLCERFPFYAAYIFQDEGGYTTGSGMSLYPRSLGLYSSFKAAARWRVASGEISVERHAQVLRSNHGAAKLVR